jgi:hypothetical protein
MKKISKLEKITFCAAFLIASYALIPTVTFETLNKLSPQIGDKYELRRLVEEKKTELNCYKPIDSRLSFNEFSEAKNVDGRYSIIIGKNKHSVSTVDHEVYHICQGHVEEESFFGKVGEIFLFEEYSATFFQLNSFLNTK